ADGFPGRRIVLGELEGDRDDHRKAATGACKLSRALHTRRENVRGVVGLEALVLVSVETGLPDVWRIANDHVEATSLHDLRKFDEPVEWLMTLPPAVEVCVGGDAFDVESVEFLAELFADDPQLFLQRLHPRAVAALVLH